MADINKTLKNHQRKFILVDIKGNAEFIYETMTEIADKINISKSRCYAAKSNHERIKKRYLIKTYRE